MAKTLTDLNTPFPIQALFLAGFKAALHDTNEYPDPQEDILYPIAQAQAAIGWNHLLQSRLSSAWEKSIPRSPSITQDHSWTTNVIETIFSEWWKLWTLRNEARHSKDAQTQLRLATDTAIESITILYG